MVRYFIEKALILTGCAYFIYAVGNYQLLANAPELAAASLVLGAGFISLLTLWDVYSMIWEYFKSKK